MSQRQSREEKAFEALLVQAIHRADREDLCINDLRDPSEAELEALKLLGDDFVDRLVVGNLDGVGKSDEELPDTMAMAGDAAPPAMFRCEGVSKELEDELARADQEIVKRKKREQNGKAT